MNDKISSFSERNGRSRGYSADDLISIVWENVQDVITTQGLLDEAYGYIPSSWGGESLGPAADDLVNGESPADQSRVWLNRALKAKVDFEYNPNVGWFVTDGYSRSHLPNVLEDDLDTVFDFLEALHIKVSRPSHDPKKVKHVDFDKDIGQKLLRDAINDDLAIYETPFKMLENGQIVALDEGAVADLADEGLKLKKSSDVKEESIDALRSSIYMYMKRGASLVEKKAAIKEVVASLESLRSKVKQNLLSDDEKDLFNLANNFAIRHQEAKQKGDYDQSIWYDWMFQVNLAALIAVIKIVQNQEDNN